MFSQETKPENSGSEWIGVTINGRDSPDLDVTNQLTPTSTIIPVTSSLSAEENTFPTYAGHSASAPCLLLPYFINQHHLHYPAQQSTRPVLHIGPPVQKNTSSSGFIHNSPVLQPHQQEQTTLISTPLFGFPNSADKNFYLPFNRDDNTKSCCACGGDCSEDQVRHIHSWVCRVITGHQIEESKCCLSKGCDQVNQVSFFLLFFYSLLFIL